MGQNLVSLRNGTIASVHLPRPLPAALLDNICQAAWQLPLISRSNPLHILAIAHSGITLATAIMMMRYQRGVGTDDLFSVIDLRRKDIMLNQQPSASHTQVIIDNSVKTGNTVNQALNVLRGNGLEPTDILKLVDYEDERESEVARVLQQLKLKTHSIFRYSEITSKLEPVD